MSAPKRTIVAEHLRQALMSGDYQPGERLPHEEELADRFGVSRGTVRTALRTLQEEGRISILPGRGAEVREYSPIVHLATEVRGGRDSERFDTGYAPNLRAQGYDSVVEEIKVVIEEVRPKVARRLGLPDPSGAERSASPHDHRIVVRRCDRFVDGVLWESQTSHMPYGIAGDTELMSPERIGRGIDQVLAELGHEREWSWDVVGARMPIPTEIDAFGLRPGVVLLVQERVTYAGDRAVRFTETVMPADRHQLLYADGDAPGELLLLASDVSIFET
ncbi:GntR family transcriptional regulator [Nocardiopsis sp. RSe5-2]|uniref:GntR family transcriptional regulator n=1 Tax=Nocardiopsis endophytica TaxID=3018445 RepID=A0ABT4U2V0_9ACTN|nr:GntR family transcriptional regulator [Nocardiopsis endophytica]MDA2811277.1 GntR family transcriptional regulator [Nocardiopsis endophytica]